MDFDNNDKRIAHWRLRLTRSLDDLPKHTLPAGYRFVHYAPGDRDTWIEIERSAKEFDTYEEGLAAWSRYFVGHEDELPERMIFVEDESGAKVATATAFYDTFGRDGSGSAWLHWVSVRRGVPHHARARLHPRHHPHADKHVARGEGVPRLGLPPHPGKCRGKRGGLAHRAHADGPSCALVFQPRRARCDSRGLRDVNKPPYRRP